MLDEFAPANLIRAGRDFGALTGPITDPPAGPYRVRYRSLDAGRGRGAVTKTIAVLAGNVIVEAAFVAWLLAPDHHPTFDASPPVNVANAFVLGTVTLVEGMRLINVLSLSLATLLARDPVPVQPQPGMRVAFLTTIVPDKEPLPMVRRTLEAARRIRCPGGTLDVWLLDEGDTPEVKEMVARVGARHFSRRGIAKYNQPTGAFKAKTKHGNYNAWLDAHGDRYDVFLSVDPDHVPMAAYAERMLGYFRDPDVAYVVGPQCYANVTTFVTRAAESQQFPFHSVIQRAGNAYGAAMLVGTNNAVSVPALRAVGGFADSITEDMATGLALHSAHNPATGRKWRSVYTPDVVAVGEGPSSWGDYFGQQQRWSRGTFEQLRGSIWPRLLRVGGLRWLHYLFITAFYPSMALGWVLGGINATLYLVLGASGIVVPPQLWLALYADATLFQLWVYVRNRKHNVSPYEEDGSAGLRGMAMTVFCAPIYASAALATLLRRPARFVVTAKSSVAGRDSLWVFRLQGFWTALLGAAIVAAFVQGYATLDVLIWPLAAVLISLAPPALSWLAAEDGAAGDTDDTDDTELGAVA